MSGFLDRDAPNIKAEYLRYLDRDILGKILFKNFCLNVIGLSESDVRIPIGRHTPYEGRRFLGDAEVRMNERWVSVEIKCAYIGVKESDCRKTPLRCWSFGRLLNTVQKRPKIPFELAFCIGIHSQGLGDPTCWNKLIAFEKLRDSQGIKIDFNACPHEAAFLPQCGILIIPYGSILTNGVEVYLDTIDTGKYGHCFSWGHDRLKCQQLWKRALQPSHESIDSVSLDGVVDRFSVDDH